MSVFSAQRAGEDQKGMLRLADVSGPFGSAATDVWTRCPGSPYALGVAVRRAAKGAMTFTRFRWGSYEGLRAPLA